MVLWTFGRFRIWYVVQLDRNNDSWKKIRNFFTGQKDDEEQDQDQNALTEDRDMRAETTEDGTRRRRKKAAADVTGIRSFKCLGL